LRDSAGSQFRSRFTPGGDQRHGDSLVPSGGVKNRPVFYRREDGDRDVCLLYWWECRISAGPDHGPFHNLLQGIFISHVDGRSTPAFRNGDHRASPRRCWPCPYLMWSFLSDHTLLKHFLYAASLYAASLTSPRRKRRRAEGSGTGPGGDGSSRRLCPGYRVIRDGYSAALDDLLNKCRRTAIPRGRTASI